jgi:hypothetical protein
MQKARPVHPGGPFASIDARCDQAARRVRPSRARPPKPTSSSGAAAGSGTAVAE